MLALNEVVLGHRHIVTKVVETEFVVRTEGDVACVCLPTGIAVRLMLVDAIYAQAMELIERSHPLGISLGEVVVDGHHMYSLAGQGIKEHRKGCHEGLSLSCRHLGDLTLMQDDTTDELNVIVHHIPCHLVSTGHPVVLPEGIISFYGHEFLGCAEVAVELRCLHLDHRVLLESSCSGLHDGECLRKNLI